MSDCHECFDGVKGSLADKVKGCKKYLLPCYKVTTFPLLQGIIVTFSLLKIIFYQCLSNVLKPNNPILLAFQDCMNVHEDSEEDSDEVNDAMKLRKCMATPLIK